MSLDEFNKHSTLGPMAGPATTPAASAGQDMHRQLNDIPAMDNSGIVPVGTTTQVFLVLSVIFLGSLAALLTQPSSIFIVMLAVISGAILGIYTVGKGLEACLAGGKALVRSPSMRSWLWVAGAAVFGGVFAGMHWFALGPFTPVQAALYALTLAVIAKLVPPFRPACAALAALPVAYVFILVHSRLMMSSVASMVLAIVVAGVVFVVVVAVRRGRQDKSH